MIEIGPGIEPVPLWLPPLVTFFLAFFMAPAGVTGAFLLLPFQVSVLGFVGPAVTPTNHLYNVVAIPTGVLGYVRERRMIWPLALLIMAGSVPGVVLGSWLRIMFLGDAHRFKLFIAFVMLLIGATLLRRIVLRFRDPRAATNKAEPFLVDDCTIDNRRLSFRFQGRTWSVPTPALLVITLVIGVIGGAYGVGGGALIAPLLVGLYGLPVHTIAGATLLATFATSTMAVAFFTLVGPHLGLPPGMSVAPNWILGLSCGFGGLGGMYAGARAQRYLPARLIEILLALIVHGLAIRYVIEFLGE